MLKRRTSWLLFIGLLLTSGIALSGQSVRTTNPTLKPLRTLLQQAEGQIDFAQAKLTIDRMMYPETNISATTLQLNAMADRIKARFPVGASNRAKLDLLMSSIYEAGPWNNQQPFRYDLDDPLGRNLRTKLIATYLSTRRGNCISMPILVLILGQKLGLSVTLAKAPLHVMVKFLDDNGEWLNIEATGGGFKYDSSYIRESNISELALRNDIYLRPLNQHESVAVMASTLMEFYARIGHYEHQLEVADLALDIDPKDVVAMTHKGGAYYLLLRDRFMHSYPNPALIPPKQVAEYRFLSQENLRWYNNAEALGWTAPSPDQETKYLELIRREKAAKGAR